MIEIIQYIYIIFFTQKLYSLLLEHFLLKKCLIYKLETHNSIIIIWYINQFYVLLSNQKKDLFY